MQTVNSSPNVKFMQVTELVFLLPVASSPEVSRGIVPGERPGHDVGKQD